MTSLAEQVHLLQSAVSRYLNKMSSIVRQFTSQGNVGSPDYSSLKNQKKEVIDCAKNVRYFSGELRRKYSHNKDLGDHLRYIRRKASLIMTVPEPTLINNSLHDIISELKKIESTLKSEIKEIG